LTPSHLAKHPAQGPDLTLGSAARGLPCGRSTVPAATVAVDDDPALALRRRVPGATAEAMPEPISEPPLRRSPDEVRALLSRYRSGLQAGRATDGTADEERS
jgi:hypothetical protein